MITFKLTQAATETTRRISFETQPTWFELSSKVSELFHIPEHNVAVSYLDAEGDEVTLSTEQELEDFLAGNDALPTSTGGGIRLGVRDLNVLREGGRTPVTSVPGRESHSLGDMFDRMRSFPDISDDMHAGAMPGIGGMGGLNLDLGLGDGFGGWQHVEAGTPPRIEEIIESDIPGTSTGPSTVPTETGPEPAPASTSASVPAPAPLPGKTATVASDSVKEDEADMYVPQRQQSHAPDILSPALDPLSANSPHPSNPFVIPRSSMRPEDIEPIRSAAPSPESLLLGSASELVEPAPPVYTPTPEANILNIPDPIFPLSRSSSPSIITQDMSRLDIETYGYTEDKSLFKSRAPETPQVEHITMNPNPNRSYQERDNGSLLSSILGHPTTAGTTYHGTYDPNGNRTPTTMSHHHPLPIPPSFGQQAIPMTVSMGPNLTPVPESTRPSMSAAPSNESIFEGQPTPKIDVHVPLVPSQTPVPPSLPSAPHSRDETRTRTRAESILSPSLTPGSPSIAAQSTVPPLAPASAPAPPNAPPLPHILPTAAQALGEESLLTSLYTFISSLSTVLTIHPELHASWRNILQNASRTANVPSSQQIRDEAIERRIALILGNLLRSFASEPIYPSMPPFMPPNTAPPPGATYPSQAPKQDQEWEFKQTPNKDGMTRDKRIDTYNRALDRRERLEEAKSRYKEEKELYRQERERAKEEKIIRAKEREEEEKRLKLEREEERERKAIEKRKALRKLYAMKGRYPGLVQNAPSRTARPDPRHFTAPSAYVGRNIPSVSEESEEQRLRRRADRLFRGEERERERDERKGMRHISPTRSPSVSPIVEPNLEARSRANNPVSPIPSHSRRSSMPERVAPAGQAPPSIPATPNRAHTHLRTPERETARTPVSGPQTSPRTVGISSQSAASPHEPMREMGRTSRLGRVEGARTKTSSPSLPPIPPPDVESLDSESRVETLQDSLDRVLGRLNDMGFTDSRLLRQRFFARLGKDGLNIYSVNHDPPMNQQEEDGMFAYLLEGLLATPRASRTQSPSSAPSVPPGLGPFPQRSVKSPAVKGWDLQSPGRFEEQSRKALSPGRPSYEDVGTASPSVWKSSRIEPGTSKSAHAQLWD